MVDWRNKRLIRTEEKRGISVDVFNAATICIAGSVYACPRCGEPVGLEHGIRTICSGCGSRIELWGNALEIEKSSDADAEKIRQYKQSRS